MGFLGCFRKSKTEPTDEREAWNRMWNLWANGRADSPYAELMTYQSEINNGGHEQYFLNMEISGDLQKEMAALKTVLPAKLWDNLQKAFEAYRKRAYDECDKQTETILTQCDDAFYKEEEEINRILRNYASKIEP